MTYNQHTLPQFFKPPGLLTTPHITHTPGMYLLGCIYSWIHDTKAPQGLVQMLDLPCAESAEGEPAGTGAAP